MPQSQELTSALHFRVVAPGPKAELLIVHGLAEYAERYRGIAEQFADSWHIDDCLRSARSWRSVGTRTHIDRFDDFVVDAEAVSRNLRSALCRAAAVRVGPQHGRDRDAVTRRAHANTCGTDRVEQFARSVQTWHQSFESVVKIRCCHPTQHPHFAWSRLKKNSRDEIVKKAYANDPLIPPTASLRLIVEFAKACNEARSLAPRISMPVLVCMGNAMRSRRRAARKFSSSARRRRTRR